MSRRRLDVALVDDGLFPTRARAQAAVMAGRVRVDGVPASKPGMSVGNDARLEVAEAPEYVSRGGLKLAHALDHADLEVAGAQAIDVGASTGGFTDVLLRRGAARVVAVDVGYGQLDWRLRTDPRVTVLERTNARHLTPDRLPYPPDLMVCDVSFISITLIWPAVHACLADGWRAVVMVKPQFEAGREAVGSGGVVRDPAARHAAVSRVAAHITASGGAVVDVADAGISGPKGNREVFVVARDARGGPPAADVEALIAEAVRAAG